MHADEAVQADRFGTLLEKYAFQYDPSEHHGPALAYATLPAAWVARQGRYTDLNEWTIRVVPALAGLALVLVSFALGNLAGRGVGGVASLFTAVSPVLVYYSRYYIPEMLLVACSAGLLFCTLAYERSPGLRWAVPAGICAGLMYATKETAVLVFLAVAAGCLAARFRFRPADLAAFALVTLAAAAHLLGSQIGESLRSLLIYADRAGSGGRHAHPWHYYVQVLAGSGDVLWLLLGVTAFVRLARLNRTAAFLGTYAAVLTLLYSGLQYKTPWCAAGFVHGWILVAAVGWAALRETRWRRAAVVGILLVTAAIAVQAVRYAFPLAADPRNPYAYAHTTRDVFEIRDRIERVARSQPSGYATAIDIFTGENWWPLPWYLRRFSQVRWWSAVPHSGRAGPVVLCSPVREEAVARLLYEGPPPGERELFVNLFPRAVWLRPDVEVRGYVAAGMAPP
jgi:predicted membrane-bound mannosyltransferase